MPLELPREPSTADVIDGLYVTGRSLVVVQPWAEGREITRIDLDDSMSGIRREEPLVTGYAGLDQPTTGAIVGSHVYVIVNSHLQTFRRSWSDGSGEGVAGGSASLSIPEILRVPLFPNR